MENLDSPLNCQGGDVEIKNVNSGLEDPNCLGGTVIMAGDKSHFFSDHSTLTNRPDAKTQISLIIFEHLGF